MQGAVDQALEEIEAARTDMALAFQAVLKIAEDGLALHTSPLPVSEAFNAIVLACAAEDIVGQRLGRAMRLLKGEEEDPLLRGPARAGEGLGQDAADALFADAFTDGPSGSP